MHLNIIMIYLIFCLGYYALLKTIQWLLTHLKDKEPTWFEPFITYSLLLAMITAICLLFLIQPTVKTKTVTLKQEPFQLKTENVVIRDKQVLGQTANLGSGTISYTNNNHKVLKRIDKVTFTQKKGQVASAKIVTKTIYYPLVHNSNTTIIVTLKNTTKPIDIAY